MMRKNVRRKSFKSILALLALLPDAATAFIDPPTFQPAMPLENQPFEVFYQTGVCDLFPFSGFPIDVIRAAPNRVQIFVTGAHVDDPILCNAPLLNARIAMPALPAGEYQLELYIRNRANPFIPIHNGPVAPLRVFRAASMETIPTLTIAGWFAMLSGVFVAAWLALRRS